MYYIIENDLRLKFDTKLDFFENLFWKRNRKKNRPWNTKISKHLMAA